MCSACGLPAGVWGALLLTSAHPPVPLRTPPSAVARVQWCMGGRARPVLVVGSGSTGAAKALTGADVEDTITLTVHWQNIASGNQGGMTPEVASTVPWPFLNLVAMWSSFLRMYVCGAVRDFSSCGLHVVMDRSKVRPVGTFFLRLRV